MTEFSLSDLENIVASRAKASADESWTAKLVQKGQEKASKKMGEEAVEAVIAAMKGDKSELTSEVADLLFHMVVVLHIAEVPLCDVMAELERRTSQSGLAEKSARSAS